MAARKKDRAVVIGISKVGRSTSFVYCLKVLKNGKIIGFPFKLENPHGNRTWKNRQIRKEGITQGSITSFMREPRRHSFKYIKATGDVWDVSKIFDQLKSDDCEAAVYQGIKKCFLVKVKNSGIYRSDEDGCSPVCALIGVKEATLVDGKITFKTLLNEEFALKNKCQNNMGSGVEEVPLPVHVSLSNQGIMHSNYALLVKLEDGEKSESKGLVKMNATCEAILAESYPLKRYKMKRKPRGMCIIVNNYRFDDNELHRHGAKVDEKALKDLFENLSFDVKIYPNLSACKMRHLAADIAKKDHRKYNALIFIVMSHGGVDDTLLGVDGRGVCVADIISEFRSKESQTLKGKPKVFLFEACRGPFSESDLYGMSLENITHSVDSTLARGTIPQEADFLLAFGSAPCYRSYLDKDYGSPFIQTLVKVIEGSHPYNHLTEMLSHVTRCVVKEFHLQVPTQSNTLRAKLYL